MLLAALLMFFEEWVWDHLKAVMARLGRLPVVHVVEVKIATLRPWGAVFVFLVPVALLLPVKVLALYLLTTHHAVLGVLVLVVAKVVGTALEVRIFTLCKPNLLTVVWFRRAHDWLVAFKERLYAYVRTYVRALPAWQQARRTVHRLRQKMAALFER